MVYGQVFLKRSQCSANMKQSNETINHYEMFEEEDWGRCYSYLLKRKSVKRSKHHSESFRERGGGEISRFFLSTDLEVCRSENY